MGNYVFVVGPGFGSGSVQKHALRLHSQKEKEEKTVGHKDKTYFVIISWKNVSGMGFQVGSGHIAQFHLRINGCTKKKLHLFVCFLDTFIL